MLNRSQLISVNPDFVCITQPDGEETPPFPISKCQVPPSGIPNTKKGAAVITQTQEDDHDSSESISTSDVADDDPDNVASIPTFSGKDNSRNWLKRRGAREKARTNFRKKFAKKMTKEEKKLRKLKPGVTVWCKHESVAEFHPDDKPRKGHRRVRVKEEGTLLKKSSYYKDCFVVAFDKGFSSTVHFKHLYFVKGTSKTHRFVRREDGTLVLKRFDRDTEEENAILRFILNSKIFRNIGHEDVTYDYLVQLFKPRYAWLTSSKLRKYVSKSRSLLRANNANVSTHKPGTWMASLPVEDFDESNEIVSALREIDDTDPNNNFRPIRNFQQNSHKNAIINQVDVNSNSENTNVARGSHAKDDDCNDPNTLNVQCSEVKDNDNNKENHGLACTCCGIHFKSVVTQSDMNQIKLAKRFHISDFMITKITRRDDGTRSVAMKMVPANKMSENDRNYTNILNKQLGIPRRYDADHKLIEDEEEIKQFDIDNNIVLKPETNFYDDSSDDSSAKSEGNDETRKSDDDNQVKVEGSDESDKDQKINGVLIDPSYDGGNNSSDIVVCVDDNLLKKNKKNDDDCVNVECNDDDDIVKSIDDDGVAKTGNDITNGRCDGMIEISYDKHFATTNSNDDNDVNDGCIDFVDKDVDIKLKSSDDNDFGNECSVVVDRDDVDVDQFIDGKCNGMALGGKDGMMVLNNKTVDNECTGMAVSDVVDVTTETDQITSPTVNTTNTDTETATIVDPKLFSLSDSIPCYSSTSKEDSVYDQYPEVKEYLGESK